MVLISIGHFNYWESLLSTKSFTQWSLRRYTPLHEKTSVCSETKPNPIWRSCNSPSDKCPNPFFIWLLLTLQVSWVHKSSTTMHSNWIQMSSTSLWSLFLGRIIEMGKYPGLQHCLQAICSLIVPMVNSSITVFIHSPVSPFKLCLQTQKKCIQDFLTLSPQSAHYTWTIFFTTTI